MKTGGVVKNANIVIMFQMFMSINIQMKKIKYVNRAVVIVVINSTKLIIHIRSRKKMKRTVLELLVNIVIC